MNALGRLVVALAAMGLWLVMVGPAGAHTDLLQGSPGPTQEVGGTVDFIDLVFFEPVADVRIQLEGPSGSLLDGEMVVADGQIIRYQMPALVDEGRYIVRFSMISADDDLTDSAFFFDYRADAFQPQRLGDVDVPDSGSNRLGLVAAIIFVVCIIGLVMIFLTRLERQRAEAGSGATEEPAANDK